jgi:transcriptional regulator with XRE-family HTH domain
MALHPYATLAGPDALALVTRAQLALGYSQRRMAAAVETSLRTVQRWSSGKAHPKVVEVRKLAILVHPHDAILAHELASLIRETPESLGLVPPAPTQAAALTTVVAAQLAPNVMGALAESVVAAAAEALDASPRVARPVLRAALERAKATGLSVDDLLSALRPVQPARTKKHAARRVAR